MPQFDLYTYSGQTFYIIIGFFFFFFFFFQFYTVSFARILKTRNKLSLLNKKKNNITVYSNFF